jgi:4-hydroxy-tetrahydrodipicolinate synthase
MMGMRMTQFSGIWVPLVTPFTDGEVDYKAAQKLATHMVDKGVHGLVVCGTTGEASALNPAEKRLLAEAVVDVVQGYCPVFMGIGGSGTREVASDAWAFGKTGIDGYLLSAPCYVRPSQAGIIGHFQHAAKATDLPIIIYNIPSRTGVNIEPETIAALCESEQFVALKECAGLPQLMKLRDDTPCNVLCGDDSLLLASLKLGGHGAISASAHIHPELFVRIYELALQQQFEKAREIFNQLTPLIQLMFSEPNPAPVKAALAMQGWIHDELRLPMLPASESCKKKLRQVLDDLDTSKPIYNINGEKAYAA